MYHKYLESFIVAADCGSLAKASEILYISPTAIMKQINQLENQLNVVLFVRSNKGLQLSEAGKLIYEDANYMIRYSKESVARAQRVVNDSVFYIRIGTSLMNPSTAIAGMLHCIAVSQTHRLAQKEEIDIEDLYEETLYITEPGDSEYLDSLRQDLICYHPKIRLILMKSFDIVIFNQCESTNNILLTTPMWGILHPMLKIIKVRWNYTVPYGIIYPLNPSTGIQNFTKQVTLYTQDHLPDLSNI